MTDSSCISIPHPEEGNCCRLGSKRSSAVDTSSVDAALAKEMNELSVEERNLVFNEIHGVAELKPESPEFVTKCIQELDQALLEQPRNRRRKAFDRAKFLRPGLESDTAFKLMFLRADYYDAKKAARRMVKYFDDKQKIFGEEKLVKKITLDDFSEEDLNFFHQSFYQVPLPSKDNSGRPVWFANLTKYDWTDADNLIRCTWYVVMATLEEEVAQMKGAVNITYWPGKCTFNPSNMAKVTKATMKVGDMIVNLPCREASFHFGYDDSGMELFLSTMRKAFGKHIRLRIREHYGSDLEMQYSLLPFGIQCPFFFFNAGDDNEKLQYLHNYLQQRQIQDRAEAQLEFEQSTRSGMKQHPSPSDVLVGRGCPYQNFSGNRMLSQLIDTQYMELYRRPTDRFGKTCLFMDVVRTIQNAWGGHFLERHADGWKIVDDKVARDKVSSAFRSKVQKFPNHASSGSDSDGGGSVPPDFNASNREAKRFRYG